MDDTYLDDRMKAVLVAAGFTLDDPKALALLALTSGVPNIVAGPPPMPPA